MTAPGPIATTEQGPERALIALLADGVLHSGADLAAGLGLTRAAVHKALHRAAGRLGLTIEALRGQGYRLTDPIELLDAAAINAALAPAIRARLSAIEVLTETDSTSNHLLRLGSAGAASGRVCLAERQRAGRGRQGRPWVAAFGGSLALSILWRFRRAPAGLGGLSLAAGVAVAEALAAACGAEGLRLVDRADPGAPTDGVGLKWPNDLHWRRRKLAGLLLEVSGEAEGPSQVVLGLGLNLRLPPDAGAVIDQPWVDLAGVHGAGRLPARNALAAKLIEHLTAALTRYDEAGFAAFVGDWRRRDAYLGQPAMVTDGDTVTAGQLAGIADDGALLLDTARGQRRILAGEVSLRLGRAEEEGPRAEEEGPRA